MGLLPWPVRSLLLVRLRPGLFMLLAAVLIFPRPLLQVRWRRLPVRLWGLLLARLRASSFLFGGRPTPLLPWRSGLMWPAFMTLAFGLILFLSFLFA